MNNIGLSDVEIALNLGVKFMVQKNLHQGKIIVLEFLNKAKLKEWWHKV